MRGAVGLSRSGTFVEASAGTGKTTVLVQAIAEAIAEGIEVDRIVAVTFTHQAAGEMKLRVRAELARQRTPSSRVALQSLDRAFIGTIHSFCAALLRQRPVEGSVDPDFIELDQGEAQKFFGTIFDRWLETKLDNPSETLKRAFAREGWREDRSGPVERLRSAAWDLAEWRDLDAPWTKRPVNRSPRVAALLRNCEAMLEAWPESRGDWQRNILRDTVDRLTRAREADVFDLDEAEAELGALGRRLRSVSLNKRSDAGKAWAELYANLRVFAREMDADLASSIRDELWEVLDAYRDAKDSLGLVDFTDLLLHARELLNHPDARSDLQKRYDRVFVDEFQDTDPLQADVLTTLATPEKLFVVGDPKQSIYRFRRAEPRAYARVRERLISSGATRRKLTTSWRSSDAIQSFVNSAFAGMPEYLPITGGPEALTDQPSIVVLPAPKPYDGEQIEAKQVVRCTPDLVAAFIEWLVSKHCSWTVRTDAVRRGIIAGDICILFRRATNVGRDLTEDYVRALEARNIPHVLVGSKGLHGREEIIALRTALRAIEWPSDELSVYAVLRGPLFGIPDNLLFRCRESGVRLRPGAKWPDDADAEFQPIRDALEILSDLHRGRNARPVAGTIRQLLEAVRGHTILAFHKSAGNGRATGVRKLANVHRLAELARQADARGNSSFRSFIEFLESEATSGEAAEAPVIEHQADGVLLMTTHKAKGSEFPVVILADPTAGLISPQGCERWIDLETRLCAQRLLRCAPWELLDHEAEEERAEREEGTRVAYVAATRAKDLLVCCAIGDTEYKDGWLSPLYDAIYPPINQWRTSRPAPGCPQFREETVLNAPLHRCQDQIRPGLHRPRVGSHEVVWFDPAALRLDVDTSGGTEREHLLDGGAAEIAEGVERYRRWRSERNTKIEVASAPSFVVSVATQAGIVPEASAIPIDFIEVNVPAPRPRGRTFGRLLHAVLQNGGLHARAIGHRFNATSEEITAAESAASVVMNHPLLSEKGARILREYPVSVRLSDGTLIEGRADVVRDDGQSITAIDYKSDADRGLAIRQLQIYAYALQLATGKPTRGFIFEI